VQQTPQTSGRLILLTGLSGAGKTTLGHLLVNALNSTGPRPAALIDGDTSRSFFEQSLGYPPAERFEATRRMAFAAHALVQSGTDVVLANIAGTHEVRSFLRRKFQRYVEVFLKADVAVLQANDPKGLYARAAGEPNPMVVGLDLPYEEPNGADLVLHTHDESPEVSL
jgi:adenylylsulfate kinase-like enzyme